MNFKTLVTNMFDEDSVRRGTCYTHLKLQSLCTAYRRQCTTMMQSISRTPESESRSRSTTFTMFGSGGIDFEKPIQAVSDLRYCPK